MKKGFTLIELLAVLVILAIISLITVVSVNSIITNSKKNTFELQQKNIEDAAKAYYIKEGMTINDNCVSVSYLVNKGYLEEEIKLDNIKDGYVKITYESNKYSYKYQEESCNYMAATEETKTTGEVPTIDEDGNIVPGSEFKIKVNDTNGWLTFFVLSNSEDGKYVNLIAEQNITPDGKFTSEPQDGDEWYVSSSNSYNNRFGPQTAYTYLSNATRNWTNIPIIQSFNYNGYVNNTTGYQSVKTELDEENGKYITTITPLSNTQKQTYENMRTRLPYKNEVIENTSCESYISDSTPNYSSCPIWMVNYLSSSDYYSTSDGKVNGMKNNLGYWTLSPTEGDADGAKYIYCSGNTALDFTNNTNIGIRPVITLLKSELLRVMSEN